MKSTPSTPAKAANSWPTTSALVAEAEHFRIGVFEALPKDQVDFLRDLLWNDASTEYDARFLTAWLRDREQELGSFSAAFWQTHDLWAAEELRHFEGLFAVLTTLFPGEDREDWQARLDARVPSFANLEPLLTDEFSVLVTGAFDELVTVRAYRANLDVYELVGPVFLRFVHLMIADEALHYSRYLQLLQEDHTSRSADASQVIQDARAVSAVEPYTATFLLDHEDPEYTEALLDSAERILLANF